MDSKVKVRVAIVGLGWWGKKLAGWLQNNSLLRVVRGVDSNPATIEEFAKSCDFPLSASYQDALEDRDIEAVVLVTPHTLHDAQIELAVAAGKHVFCEKPLSLTRAGAEKSVRALQQRKLVLGLGHERRWEPPIRQLIADARSGAMGELMQLEANFSHDKFRALAKDNWRLSKTNAPAGGMTATGIHLFDIATAVFGEGETAFASAVTRVSGVPDDSTCALVRYRNGCTAYVSTMLATPFISRIALFGSEAWVEVVDKAHVESPDGWRVTKCIRGGNPVTTEVPPTYPARENLEAFARAVRGEAPYPIPVSEMIANTAVMEAIFESARSGRPQPI